MGWISGFRGSGQGELANPWNETVINGAPYDADKATRSRRESPEASGDRPDTQIAEEIKRRQVSLAVRYIIAVRAR
jgi:hypothetical protein